MIVTISDHVDNGKGNNRLDIIALAHHVMLEELELPFAYVPRVIVMNFNEDGRMFTTIPHYMTKHNIKTWEDYIAHLCKLTQRLQHLYPTCTIVNDPRKCAFIGMKRTTLTRCMDMNHVPCPAWWTSKHDAIQYPVVARLRPTKNMTEHIFTKASCAAKMPDKWVLAIQYVDTYHTDLKAFLGLRLMVLGNQLVDWYMRPSDSWIVKSRSQKVSCVHQANEYGKQFMQRHVEAIQHMLDELYESLGEGCYAHDLSINVKDDTFYVTELSLKYCDNMYIDFLTQHNIDIGKHDYEGIKGQVHDYFVRLCTQVSSITRPIVSASEGEDHLPFLKTHTNLLPSDTFLDIGCGKMAVCSVVSYLDVGNYYGMDRQSEVVYGVGQLDRYYTSSNQQCAMQKLKSAHLFDKRPTLWLSSTFDFSPLGSRKVNVIFIKDVWTHFTCDQIKACLAQCRPIMTPTSIILASFTLSKLKYDDSGEDSEFKKRSKYSLKHITSIVESQGFRCTYMANGITTCFIGKPTLRITRVDE